ncbi:MAG: alanine--tRNA ligase [Desulfomicrobium sp.]|nr:alanine--tRNA ligase [Desulfomicrobium sp.]
MISAAEIRTQFLQYFQAHGHSIEPSSSLVPQDDPTLLFTNAGMVQFKKIFQGQERRDYLRAATSQKCLRVGGKHNDLENVGRTARHHTFFEMLGNFSFGDYFKEKAIELAWNFITQELDLDKDRLYISIFREDDEAGDLWQKVAGVPANRIYRLDEADNFWAMGDTGPCGPCSEIYVDQGADMSCGPDCGIGRCDCDRFLEIWNLVFMQFNRAQDGTMTPLPKPSIDTGMGLERITAVCQGKRSNFDTDLFQGLIQAMAQKAGVSYGDNYDTDTALRVIADHSRAIAFLLADGMLPSNEGRGYVLRRLIRRAYRFGKLLGFNQPFLYSTADQVVREMGHAFPELTASREFMLRVVRQEEERFGETLDKGLQILESEMTSLEAQGQKSISGTTAFKLYDTYGFPLDIVNDIAQKQNFIVDEAGFQQCMAVQKKKSKEAWAGSGDKGLANEFANLLSQGLESEFVGYDCMQTTSRILALLDDQGQSVTSLDAGTGFMVTLKTPFYGESGGQMGDTGRVQAPTGTAQILDTLKPAPNLIVHKIEISSGEILADQEVTLLVEEGERMATARNHTATHLLHAALRRILGSHVKQAGSLVGPSRLRFDFTHISGLAPEELRQVEDEVNRAILANAPVIAQVMDYDQAIQDKQAVALFGEKYDAQVRVIEMPGESVELCGGTHLSATGQAGSFAIVSEGGIAAGVRRIEALTGWDALHYWQSNREEIRETAQLLKAIPGEVGKKVRALQEQNRALSKELSAIQTKMMSASGKDLATGVKNINGLQVLTCKVDSPDINALRNLMDDLRSKISSGIIALAADIEHKAMLLVSVSKDLHDRYTAPALIKEICIEIKGGGGGRPDLAQAGGSDPAGIERALAKLEAYLQQ